ncbi:MAG TPA: UDP-2,3-diacylglucosamine diphosphatase LpxI [Myxococcota bacterium]|nr:UDP-2,3-diacylglucosamine diphosphatase LpxI [Myxococcota bacterium]
MLGLIAGRGRFPIDLARAARRRGGRVVAVAFHGDTEAALADEVDELHWLHLGELETLIARFRAAGARQAVMAGKVLKTSLFGDLARLKPDARAIALIAGLRTRSDDSILGAIADELAGEGITLLPQAALVPELLAGEGTLGAIEPTSAQRGDIAFGWPIAKALGALDVGQTVVVRERAVLALEAIEGTDAAVARGAALGGPGASVIKVAKPRQDPRFDVPAVGLGTLAALAEGKVAVLAVEADRTFLLDRAELLREADRHRIAVLGIRDHPLTQSGGRP